MRDNTHSLHTTGLWNVSIFICHWRGSRNENLALFRSPEKSFRFAHSRSFKDEAFENPIAKKKEKKKISYD